MRTSRKTLSLALLLLLVPTAAVAWIGLREIGRLEVDVRDSLTSGLQSVLRGVEDDLELRLGNHTREATSDLRGRSLYDVVQRIASSVPAGNEVRSGLLLHDRSGAPLWPVRAPREGIASVQLAPNMLGRNNRELGKLLLEADVLAGRGKIEDAAEHLLSWKEPRSLAVDARARLAWERGRYLRRGGQLERARDQFTRANRLARSFPRNLKQRSGVAALRLVIRVLLLQTQKELLESTDTVNVAARESLHDAAVTLLGSIAVGDFDGESDAWLDRMFARVKQLAGDSATGKANTALSSSEQPSFELEEIELQRARHVATRILQRALVDGDLGTLETTKNDFVTKTVLAQEGSDLVAFSKLRVQHERGERNVWVAVPIDVAAAMSPIAEDVERRLADAGREYRLVMIDANGRNIFGDSAKPEELANPAFTAATARHSLGSPLLGLSVELRPNNISALTQSTRRSILVKSLLLVALALVAGVGAFLLVRTVRRESELANLRTEFVGRVSHELKTPLALIRMYGETLAMGRVRDSDKAVEFASVIAKESNRLTDMIDRVLEFSKVDAGSRTYTPERTRVDRLVADVVENYRPHLEDYGFEVILHDAPEIEIDVDREGLTQAIVNLLSNARKYCEDDDEKRIDIGIDLEGSDAVLRVRDRGIGVPDDERDKIFDTFYRARTAGERRGAGLGLALVRNFAEEHGGSCRCVDRRTEGDWPEEPENSRNDAGSTFVLRLPLPETGTSQ